MGQSSSEFDLISQYFHLGVPSSWPSQGIGDDCAIVCIGGQLIAITSDTVAIGTHFLPHADPYTVGRKALAVNLSDLAAAGASPRIFFLALSLPKADHEWLSRFSAGLKEEAQRYGCALLGGDTTKTVEVGGVNAAPTMTITAMGQCEVALTRAGARLGDDIWVSGTPGDAYAALKLRWGHWQGEVTPYLASRMDTPTPRVALGQAIATIASACADVSDGLLQDLGHILERSDCGAVINVDRLAVSEDLSRFPIAQRREAQWAGGDDYELVFTAPKSARARIEALSSSVCPVSRIGEIVASGLRLEDAKGNEVSLSQQGFDHFGN